MKKIVLRIIEMVVGLLVVGISIILIVDPNGFSKNIDSFIYNITGNHVFVDANTLINKNDVIKVAKNKDYSKSIFYPYYELLNNDEKEIYDELLTEINKYNKSIKLTKLLKKDIITKIYTYLSYDHPEIFWMDNTYNVLLNENEEVFEINFKYIDTDENIDKKIKQLDIEINKIVNEAKKIELDYEKELYVHDKLSELITYGKIENQTVYDAIINKTAVCSGYSKAFQLIMMKLGIPTYYVTGYSRENHAWNLIELEDGLYNIDLTWDDQEDRIIYNYFNLSESIITIDHKRDEVSLLLPKALGTKYINSSSPMMKKNK